MLSALVVVTQAPPAQAASGPYTATYNGRTSGTTCTTTRNILYYTPTSGSNHPLLVWLHGTFASYDDARTKDYLQYMADAGFVAASIEYDNDADVVEQSINEKTACIFSGSSTSAVNSLDALGSVDVSKGIFVSGLSQGSLIANRSKNVNNNVRAAFLTGVADKWGSITYPSQLYSATSLVNVRAVNGQADSLTGTAYCFTYGQSNARQLEHITGVDYGDPCWPDTAGAGNTTDLSWYTVPGYGHTAVFLYMGLQPCSVVWSQCAIKNWALAQVTL